MVSSNLIDVEVMFRNHTNIKKKIMIDSKNNTMQNLINRILEVCEIFPKLSGLNKLKVKNLKKKTEKNEEIDLIEGVNFLKPKDVILFDLSFQEVWLDIQMTLICGDLKKKIQFELRVNLGKNENDFQDILINLGITSFSKISGKNDFYIFKKLNVDYSHKENFVNNNIYFNFDDELKCSLEFLDLSEFVYGIIKQNDNFSHSLNNKIKEQKELEKKKDLINYFNNFFEDYFEKKNEKEIVLYHKILWKYQIEDEIFEERNSSSSDSRNSLLEKRDIFSLNRNGSSSLISNFPIQPTNSILSFGYDENENYFENNYQKEIQILNNNIDYVSLIKKYSQSYISYSAFLKKNPSTRNLVEINNNKEESFEIDFPNNHYNNISNNNNLSYNNNNNNYNNNINYININNLELEERLNLRKKLKVVCICLIVFVIVIIIKRNF